MLMITQARIGSSTAHRKGLERAHAEQNISQPAVGSAHNTYTGSENSTLPITRSGWEWVNTAVLAEMPLTVKVSADTTHSTRPSAMPTPTATSGASSSAQTSLDSTVSRSEIGRDFQNSTLRSRRSSYRLPSA